MTDLPTEEVPAALAVELERVTARLRRLPQSRLQARVGPHPCRAGAALAAARRLAQAAQGIEQRHGDHPPAWRQVPQLDLFAVGDQLAVTGADVLAAANELPSATLVWTPLGRAELAEVLAGCLATLQGLRAVL